MDWRTYFYIVSLILVWGFLISGFVIGGKKLNFKNEISHGLIYYLCGIWMPQIYVILGLILFIFDNEEFRKMVVNNYSK